MSAVHFGLVAAALALTACGDKPVDVVAETDADYNHSELEAAVDQFVTAGRTPEAYQKFSKTVLALRGGMDHTVANEAELRLLVLALAPVTNAKQQSMPEQVEALALTVWPTLLHPPFKEDAVLIKRDPKAALLQPLPDEGARAYLQRLCGGALAGECKQVVPELQGALVQALATRNAMERVRNSVAKCQACKAEPGWRDAVQQWEALDRSMHGTLFEIERRGDPQNWPIAGNASEDGTTMDDPTALWREAEINAIGEVVINGQRYFGEQRIAALRELRGDSETISLHLRPELTLAQVKGILSDAKKAGATKVAVVARTPEYPWLRRIYWLSDAGRRIGLRPSDSLQLLLHTIDHVAGPGAVARVD
ncbi:MAG: ExbD/TolR family protein [Kofleriaceae bacterium]